MADIFISYAREDREWVEKLANALVAEGFTVWWDWDLLVGKRYRETIETELQTAKAAVVVWSQHSIRSDFVRDEAEDAQQRNILLPLLKEIVRPPAGFRQLQTADLAAWRGDAAHTEFRRMMKGVSSLVGRPATGDHGTIAVDPAHPTLHFEEPKPVADAAPPAPVPPPEPQPEARIPPAAVVAPTVAPVIPQPQPPHPAAFVAPSRAMNPLILYAIVGVVVLVALLFVAGLVLPSSKHAAPPANVTAVPAAPAANPTPPAGQTVSPVAPPATDGDAGSATGDVGQGGQHNTAPPPAAPAPPAETPPPAGTNDSGDTGSGNTGSTDTTGGDTGQGNNPHQR